MKLVSAIAAALSAIVFRLMMYETNLTELSGWSSSPPYSCPTCSIITRAKQNWIRNYDSFGFTKVYDLTSSYTLAVCVCGPHFSKNRKRRIIQEKCITPLCFRLFYLPLTYRKVKFWSRNPTLICCLTYLALIHKLREYTSGMLILFIPFQVKAESISWEVCL